MMIPDSHNYFLKLVNSISDAVFTVTLPERVIEYINTVGEALFGYTAEESVGRTTRFLYPENDDYEAFAEKLKLTMASGRELLETTQILRRKNGELFTAEIRLGFIRENGKVTKVISVVRDVTDRIQTEEALKSSEEKFRQLAENIVDVFWLGSPDWETVYYISPAYEKVWGKSCNSLYRHPKSWIDSVHEEDRHQVISHIPEKEKISSVLVFPQYRIRHSDGTTRWIFARAFPIKDIHGEVYRIAGIAKDITNRKNDEHIILQNNLKIERQAKELQKVNSALEVLLEHRNRQINTFKDTYNRSLNQLIFPELISIQSRLENDSDQRTVSKVIFQLKQLFSSGIDLLADEKYGLTKMELKIAMLIRENMTSSEMAKYLNISTNTVGFHRKNLRKKLGVSGSGTSLCQHLNQRTQRSIASYR